MHERALPHLLRSPRPLLENGNGTLMIHIGNLHWFMFTPSAIWLMIMSITGSYASAAAWGAISASIGMLYWLIRWLITSKDPLRYVMNMEARADLLDGEERVEVTKDVAHGMALRMMYRDNPEWEVLHDEEDDRYWLEHSPSDSNQYA